MENPQKKSGKKRRSSKKQADAEPLNQDELVRRRRQRDMRDLALRLRAEGKVYRQHKKHKPRRRVQCIVIPIAWKKNEKDAKAVQRATEAVVQLLRDAGVKADIDSTTELTPGQKMRNWEEKGVKVRVEIGPKEADAGQAVLAICKGKAGEVADKRTVEAGQQLCDLVRQQLEAMGQTVAPPPAQQQQAAAGGGAAGGGAEDGGAQQGQAGAAAKQQQQQQHRSADDLEGDFGAPPEEEEEQPKSAKKQKKKKKDAKVVTF